LKGVAHDGLQRGKGIEEETFYKSTEGFAKEI
jgi:hypothetical protein